MTKHNLDNNPTIGFLDYLGCALWGFLFGFFAALILIGFRTMYVLADETPWLSWPMTILIAFLTPGTCAIIGACNTRRLVHFFRSKFWRRTLRIGLGIIGSILILIGGAILFTGFPEMFFSLLFLPLGLWMLWTVFRGKDEDVANWWDAFFSY